METLGCQAKDEQERVAKGRAQGKEIKAEARALEKEGGGGRELDRPRARVGRRRRRREKEKEKGLGKQSPRKSERLSRRLEFSRLSGDRLRPRGECVDWPHARVSHGGVAFSHVSDAASNLEATS